MVKRLFVAMVLVCTVVFGSVGVTAAQPKGVPDHANDNACVGRSSTTANATYDDPSKERSTQARADDGQPGRADSVANDIPECDLVDLDRGHDAGE